MKLLGLLGLPGAGKTTAMNDLTDRVDHDFEGLQMKEVAAEEYHAAVEQGIDAFPDDLQENLWDAGLDDAAVPTGDFGNEIADFVDTILSVQGDYFALKAADHIDSLGADADVVVVDGIRSVADADGLATANADAYHLVYLHTPFHVRLERLQGRGRDGEEDIDATYLADRDEQELSWGVDDILLSYEFDTGETEYPVEYFYANHDSLASFSLDFNSFVDNLLALD